MPAVHVVRIAGLTLALTAATQATALDIDYTLGIGIEHSNNINLTATDPISQNILEPTLNFSATQLGSDVQANVGGTVLYRDFLGGAFSDQVLGLLSGKVNWSVLPQRLDLTVEDYAGVQPVNVLASNTPGNQQQTNVFAVGPTFHFLLGGTLHGQAELRYIDSYAQKTDEFNSQRGSAALRVLEDINPTDQLSANLQAQHIDFTTAAGGPNYDHYDLFGRYLSKLANLDLDVSLGWSQLDFGGGMPSASAPLARANVAWRMTPRSTVTVGAARVYSDAVEDMLLVPSPAGIGSSIVTGNAVIGSQVFLERRLQATYAFVDTRVSLSVTPLYRNLDYINDPRQNQTAHGADFQLGYRISEPLTLSLQATGETSNYETSNRTDKLFGVGLNLAGQWTSHWGWNATLARNRRTSTELNQGYQENKIYFGVQYKR
ncbi:MAG: hypothetical protein ABI082_08350 [Dokdonella sp.]